MNNILVISFVPLKIQHLKKYFFEFLKGEIQNLLLLYKF